MTTTTLRKCFTGSPDLKGDWIVSISDHSEWGEYNMDDWTDMGLLPYFGPISKCPDILLDHEYSTGFGSPARPCYAVWTTNYVISCTEYDGSTSSHWVSRNPPHS